LLVYEKSTTIRATAEEVFAWHARPEALADLIPPFDDVRIVSRTGTGLEEGSRVVLSMKAGLFRQMWVAEHRDVIPGRQFKDVMVKGPFKSWEHTHRFEPAGEGACRLLDHIECALPLGLLGRLLGGRFVRKKLARTFEWRHETTRKALEGP
jgi:ligand-binding SRPBCC domain-containing protein